MQMLTVQTSCKKQYTCKVFVLLFHDTKIVKLNNCGKHQFLRIFLCGRKSRIWSTIFYNVSSLNWGQGSEKFGWSSSRKCSCWIPEWVKWGLWVSTSELWTEAIDLTAPWLWKSQSCRDGNKRCKSSVLVTSTYLGLAHPHLFFFRELLFVPVSLTRREALKSQVLSD